MLYRFGEFELDLSAFELRVGDVAVPMEPQAFDVLAYLVSNRDRVVSKQELMDQVWGDRFVTEAAVTSRIKQARRAIGDDGDAQRLIRTLHGRGYRFVASVTSVASDAPPERDGLPERGQVRYAISDGLSIAYQVTGSGEHDIVLVAGFVSHLELDWAHPRHADFLDRLASFGRLIRFDKRGTGLSDRQVGVPDLETRIHDVLAVMDAAGSTRAVLFGYSEGGPMAIRFAAGHPDRVKALVMYGAYAKRTRTVDYPWAPTPEDRARYAEQLAAEWSWEADLRLMCPSADDAMARWWGLRARAAATPSDARAMIAMNSLVDVRDVLHSVRVPTLVLHRRGDADSKVEEGRYLADHIPGARFVQLAGADHFVGVDPDQILDHVEPFVGGLRSTPAPELALCAILAVSGMGADAAVERLAHHRARLAVTSGGRRIVLYDGPAAAIRAGLLLLSQNVYAQLAVGVHVAEVARSAHQIEGRGVQTVLDLADKAALNQVWTSQIVRDLVAETGIVLSDDGDHFIVRSS
jgi:DNA-binding winged helix-turn-helix (wHTH) protein/pimeloyl-ACP methyl ester carboxylesterase